MAKPVEEETASVEQVVDGQAQPVHVDEPVEVDGFVLDRTTPPEVSLPKWAIQVSFGYEMHTWLKKNGWKLVGGACDSKERGLVYIAPFHRFDGTEGVTLRVSWRRN
jgi:hypothetical protein